MQVQGVVPWTVFMYRHPEVQYTELGFGGRGSLLLVWLFGKEWTTRQIVLDSSRWYAMCVTWTHTAQKPILYIDGIPEDLREGRCNKPHALGPVHALLILHLILSQLALPTPLPLLQPRAAHWLPTER